jgi:hypothetical protein
MHNLSPFDAQDYRLSMHTIIAFRCTFFSVDKCFFPFYDKHLKKKKRSANLSLIFFNLIQEAAVHKINSSVMVKPVLRGLCPRVAGALTKSSQQRKIDKKKQKPKHP